MIVIIIIVVIIIISSSSSSSSSISIIVCLALSCGCCHADIPPKRASQVMTKSFLRTLSRYLEVKHSSFCTFL